MLLTSAQHFHTPQLWYLFRIKFLLTHFVIIIITFIGLFSKVFVISPSASPSHLTSHHHHHNHSALLYTACHPIQHPFHTSHHIITTVDLSSHPQHALHTSHHTTLTSHWVLMWAVIPSHITSHHHHSRLIAKLYDHVAFHISHHTIIIIIMSFAALVLLVSQHWPRDVLSAEWQRREKKCYVSIYKIINTISMTLIPKLFVAVVFR